MNIFRNKEFEKAAAMRPFFFVSRQTGAPEDSLQARQMASHVRQGLISACGAPITPSEAAVGQVAVRLFGEGETEGVAKAELREGVI